MATRVRALRVNSAPLLPHSWRYYVVCLLAADLCLASNRAIMLCFILPFGGINRCCCNHRPRHRARIPHQRPPVPVSHFYNIREWDFNHILIRTPPKSCFGHGRTAGAFTVLRIFYKLKYDIFHVVLSKVYNCELKLNGMMIRKQFTLRSFCKISEIFLTFGAKNSKFSFSYPPNSVTLRPLTLSGFIAQQKKRM